MKKGILIFFIVLVVLILGLGAYFYFFPKKAQNILVPKIEQVEKLNIKIVGDTALTDIALRMENKGPFKMNIDSLIYHIKFDTMNILSKAQDIEVILNPGDVDTTHFEVSIPYARIVKRIRQLQDRDSADIETDIRIVYSTVFGRRSLPHKKLSRIGMPRPPKFEVEKIEFVKRDKKTFYLNAHLKMSNYGQLKLIVSDLEYTIQGSDLFTASGKDSKVITINPKSVIRETLPVKVKFQKLFKTVSLVIRDKDVIPYTIHIKGSMQGNKGEEKTAIEIEKKGMLELKK